MMGEILRCWIRDSVSAYVAIFLNSAIHQRLITSATLNPTARKRSKNRNMFILSPTPSVSFVFKVIVQITVVKYVMAGHCAISQ